ncbi:immunity protein YezG family protein [Gorillibacterium sp. CAU 1737]|uniref:immunity protein YezG family protein n=1 Tax=Gorillibacterium sp. CAU 1737 TaxID=3140362 RepID=UPI003261BBCA
MNLLLDPARLNDLYEAYAGAIVDMIPEKWSRLLLYGEIAPGVAKQFFFYYPQDSKEPIHCHDIPELFHLNQNAFDDYWYRSVDVLRTLHKEWEASGESAWTNLTLSLDRTGHFKIDYDYSDLSQADDHKRTILWCYKHLGETPSHPHDKAFLDKHLASEIEGMTIKEERLKELHDAYGFALRQLIPEEWSTVSLYAEAYEKSLNQWFYYTTASDKTLVKAQTIPKRCAINPETFDELWQSALTRLQELWEEWDTTPQLTWTSLILHMDNTGALKVEYDCDYEPLYTLKEPQRILLWEYNQLGKLPTNKRDQAFLDKYLAKTGS